MKSWLILHHSNNCVDLLTKNINKNFDISKNSIIFKITFKETELSTTIPQIQSEIAQEANVHVLYIHYSDITTKNKVQKTKTRQELSIAYKLVQVSSYHVPCNLQRWSNAWRSFQLRIYPSATPSFLTFSQAFIFINSYIEVMMKLQRIFPPKNFVKEQLIK